MRRIRLERLQGAMVVALLLLLIGCTAAGVVFAQGTPPEPPAGESGGVGTGAGGDDGPPPEGTGDVRPEDGTPPGEDSAEGTDGEGRPPADGTGDGAGAGEGDKGAGTTGAGEGTPIDTFEADLRKYREEVVELQKRLDAFKLRASSVPAQQLAKARAADAEIARAIDRADEQLTQAVVDNDAVVNAAKQGRLDDLTRVLTNAVEDIKRIASGE